MSAAVMGTRYSPPSPPETQSSSETMSPIYPDRPIKPLPKRRLKDRLSTDAADTISYPPAPQANNSLFYPSSYESSAQQQFQKNMENSATPDIDQVLIDAQAAYPPKDTPYEFHGTDPISDDESGRTDAYRSHAIRAPSHSVTSAESDHGYDSFENSNNKKKRKIPTSSSAGILHPSLAGISADLANMGLSGANEADVEDGGTQQYYGQGYPAVPVSGTGISGAGRGRYGRSGRRDSRSPLSASANASNWQTGRMASARHVSGKYSGKADLGESGIISQAIADAAASPILHDKGQENISLLEQQQQRAPKKNTAAAQFTFNLDSEAAKGPAWPGDRLQAAQYPSPPPALPSQQLPPNAKGYSQGTQTSPSMSQGGAGQAGQQPAPPPKPRRSASVRYARAARQRKLDQQYENYHHPPRQQDRWICEFCEYESIFGTPPVALIRQYEMKDAKERRKQAERKRLLDKAKSKGRKARKGTKASKANAAATAAANASAPANGQQQPQQGYANTGQPPPDLNQHHSDEYYSGDAYDIDGDPPTSTPTPTKIPGPVSTPYGASSRPSDRNAPVPVEAQRRGPN